MKRLIPIFLAVAFLFPASAFAIGVEEIVNKANATSYYQGNDGRAKVAMEIKDSQGRVRKREFTILRRDVDQSDNATGDQKFYVFFNRPADVNKTVFLVWKHVDKDDDRWLYLPALDLVKRIAASDKRTSFVGSNFFYEDVSGRNPKDDTHEIVEETDNYYVLKSTPKSKKGVEFDHYKSWIHKASFLPVKTEYYDAKGEAYRRYEATKVDTIDGFKTVTQSKMSDLRSGESTSMSYEAVKYNVGLPDDIFTERYLKRPPNKYLK